jgi:DNA-binding FadR family transcriptional regulator
MKISFKKQIFKPIINRRTFEEVSYKIKKLIFIGDLKPNEKLPSETELARQFGVGRQTVREALRLLELSGFITIQRGSTGGPFIKDTILNTISNSFLDAFRMKKVSTHELTEARLEIEKSVLYYLFKNCEDSDIESLQENINMAKKDTETNIHPYKYNIEFHKLLARASKNQIFVIIVESLLALVANILSEHEAEFEVSKRFIYEHEDILNAIINKKYDEAVTLLEKHLINARKEMQ